MWARSGIGSVTRRRLPIASSTASSAAAVVGLVEEPAAMVGERVVAQSVLARPSQARADGRSSTDERPCALLIIRAVDGSQDRSRLRGSGLPRAPGWPGVTENDVRSTPKNCSR